jgi:hypothetical protein
VKNQIAPAAAYTGATKCTSDRIPSGMSPRVALIATSGVCSTLRWRKPDSNHQAGSVPNRAAKSNSPAIRPPSLIDRAMLP